MIVTCANPATWHPTLHRNETHHNPPKSWTDDAGASSDTWDICGLCHNEIHALNNEYVRANGRPPWEILRTYGYFIRDRAAEAWERRPLDRRPPWTSAH